MKLLKYINEKTNPVDLLYAGLSAENDPNTLLDAAIAKHLRNLGDFEIDIGGDEDLEKFPNTFPRLRYWDGYDKPVYKKIPKYTLSIDAALTLITKPYDWQRSSSSIISIVDENNEVVTSAIIQKDKPIAMTICQAWALLVLQMNKTIETMS